ncbi:hypothetical protein A3D77_07285 [Candidatus Gottesmanbacteria bacterium RIFCSPHIGHO2_02_FULL_39_11]|uniref:Glycosyltransferase 2-like domain-containing protein n=1 Tax=Candidatus Gottesmanbacteria bacterium RIFCSPHIGHO2_02_FULL_39_11 TaxID=1798382 RepID=A0A1F5ZL57_9BACT|nr:MAG: hypothetical protein A3D77_07285 [Candidatus Gottesmanbacteria bacterium RIFCSPHIGHO2_02_FULL_39_11]
MKLSVALATYNEEENIARCLNSISGWADEIVIVDGKSNDKTVDIAKKYNARIILKENEENFHKNKQIAIENCKGEWILQLDADEEVTNNLKDEILKVVSHPERPKGVEGSRVEPVSGYWIPRKNYFLGKFLKKGGQYPDYTLRLYRRGKGKLPALNVHEQAEVAGKTEYLKNPLLHYNYPDLKHYFDHFKRYTDIFANEIIDENYKEKSRHPERPKGVEGSRFLSYMLIKPFTWFISTYIRHKGFMDGYQGFLFSFFSSLRFPVSYIKALKINYKK